MEEERVKALVFSIRDCYFQWTSISPLEADIRAAIAHFSPSQQEEFQAQVIKAIRSPSLKEFPVLPLAKSRMLRKLILILEETCCEVDDGLYELLSENEDDAPSSVHFKTYFLKDDVSISLEEKGELIRDGTTGLRTWEAAHFLLRYLQENPTTLSDRRVLELGSGSGFTGLALIKLGLASDVILSDCHGTVLQALANNCRCNLSSWQSETTDDLAASLRTERQRVGVVDLDWNEFSPELAKRLAPELVLAADVVFDPSIIAPLVNTLEMLLSTSARAALIACTLRNPTTIELFERQLSQSQDLKFHSSRSCDKTIEFVLFKIERAKQ